MSGPCFKQTVTATLIATNGNRYIGTNDCKDPQTFCPRDKAGFKSGEGYELCQSVCKQTAHAEVNAIHKAYLNDEAKDSTIYVEGHTYACKDCTKAADEAGVKEIIIGSPPNHGE